MNKKEVSHPPGGVLGSKVGTARRPSRARLESRDGGARGVRMATPYMLFEQPRAFRGPSRVWFGAHAADRIADDLAELGVRPGAAFLVTDAVVERLGLARGVAAGLTAAGGEVHRYADIPGEPSVEVAGPAVS